MSNDFAYKARPKGCTILQGDTFKRKVVSYIRGKVRKGNYNDFTYSEGVIPVNFLKELLKEAFELNPQSKARA